MKPLLLHHCCAPCSPKVVEALDKRFKLTGFWFNPNIQPAEEFEKRKTSLADFAARNSIPLIEGPAYAQQQWFEKAAKAKDDRCAFCYRLRLEETAVTARREGIGHISTTLLSSPYQKHDTIRSLGAEIAAENGVEFVYEDFRPRYCDGKNEAYRSGAYMQKYCGCLFSLEERKIRK